MYRKSSWDEDWWICLDSKPKYHHVEYYKNYFKDIQICLRVSNSEGSLTVVVDDTEVEELKTVKFLGIHLYEWLTLIICVKYHRQTFTLKEI